MKLNLLFGALIFTISSLGQTIGPGGIGLSNELSIWLDASTISASNGSTVSNWSDISGNNNHFLQTSASLKPSFVESSSINSKPAVLFSNDNLFSSSISSLNTSNISWFIVSKTSATGLQVLFRSNYSSGAGSSSQSAQLLGLYSSSSGGVIQYVRASNGVLKGNTSSFSTNSNIISSIWGNSQLLSYKNNSFENSIATGNVSPAGHNLICIGANSSDPSINYLSFSGEIAEIIIYNTSLNNAQRIILNNYLSSKYNISISDDKYSFDTNHGNEVSGIGREDISNQQLDSKGSGVIQFQAASLDNSDYFMWGHDNGNLTATSTGIPSNFPASLGKIIERVWRVSETGETGDLTLTVDLSSIGFGGENDYKLLIDSDGDFSSGTTEIDGVFNSNSVTFSVLSSQISDGNYFTIGNTNTEIKSISTGDWSNILTWDCSCVPTVANDVTIVGTHNVTVSSSAVANNLTIDGTLSLSELIDIEGDLTNNGTISSSGSRIFIAGDWDNSSSGSYSYSAGDSVTFDGTSNLSTISGSTDWDILTVNNSNGVTISSGNQNIFGKLNIKSGTLTTGSLLTLKSDVNGTAQMDNIESGTISGDITIERYLDLTAKDGWREVTSPLQGSSLQDWQNDGVIFSGFTGSDFPTISFVSAYTYNEPTANNVSFDGWASASNISNSVSANNGHRIYFDSLVYTLTTSGTPNTGTQVINVTQNGGAGNADQENGWNLIGNPYASTVDWNKLSVSDKNNIESSIWIFNQTSGNYGVWNGSSGTLGVDNQIASSQAFWVHATSSNGSVTFNEEDKVNDDKAFIRSHPVTEHLTVNLTSNINSFFDELVISRLDSATSSFNPEVDLLKLFTDIPDEAPSLYSITDDSLYLSVNCIEKDNNNEVFFHAKAGNLAAGIYTLNFSIPELFMDKGCIFLTDLFTDSIIDLRQTNTYSFSSNDSVNPRFKISFYRDYDVNLVDASCYSNNDGQILIIGDSISGSTFSLFDSSGVIISSTTANSQNIIFNNLFSGNYTISTDMSNECYNNISEIQLKSPNTLISNFEVNSDSLFFGSQPAQLQLTNLSLGHNISEWNFGDGYFSNETHPVHFYTDSGQYSISLTVMDTNINNCSNTFEKLIEVIDSLAISGNQEIKNEIDLSLVNSKLNISSLNEIKSISISIFNSIGQMVYDKKINNISQKDYAIPLNLPVENIYIARIYINKVYYMYKFYID